MAEEKVIIILCDTLRAKSLPHYGNERNTTPNLNPVIEEDFNVYMNAYSAGPWTPPSHLSLFTGLYPSQVMENPLSCHLKPIFKSLPELFKDSGYKTFAFSTNPLISKKLGFAKGFDTFLQFWLPNPEEDEIMLYLKGNNRFEKLLTLFQQLAKGDTRVHVLKGLREKLHLIFRSVTKDATLYTNRSMNLLKQHIWKNKEQKVFCFVNLLQTHNTYNPPRATRNKLVKHNAKLEKCLKKTPPSDHYAVKPFSEELIEYIKLRYEEEILYLDIAISDFINFLKDNNLYDSSILIITSDHGEHFGENGHISHAYSVYEPLIRIPLYIKWPGKSENNKKYKDDPVMLQDLYSTFLTLLNHWHPCPESSFSLTSSYKRSWILSQMPDMSNTVRAYQERHPTFSLEAVGLEDNSLNAYVFSDGTKIIENGNKILCYDLKNDPEEKKPNPLTVEKKEMLEKIKASIA